MLKALLLRFLKAQKYKKCYKT